MFVPRKPIGRIDRPYPSLYSKYRINIRDGDSLIVFELGTKCNTIRTVMPHSELASAANLNARFSTKIYTLFNENFNIVGSRSVLAHTGNESVDEDNKRTIESIDTELIKTAEFNGGCIVYPGFYKHPRTAIATARSTIAKLGIKSGYKLVVLNHIDRDSLDPMTLLTSRGNAERVSHAVDIAAYLHNGMSLDDIAARISTAEFVLITDYDNNGIRIAISDNTRFKQLQSLIKDKPIIVYANEDYEFIRNHTG